MKYLCILLLAVSAICSTCTVAAKSTVSSGTAAVASGSHNNQKPSLLRSLQSQYEPWPNGTPVAWNFPNDGWWSGSISHFSISNSEYTVTWEDGSLDYYDDYDQIDQMVAYARNDPNNSGSGTTYPLGTRVGEREDGIWYVGTITSHHNGQYTVRWDGTDGETERFASGPLLSQMVADASKAEAALANGSAVTTTDAPTEFPTDAPTDVPVSATTTPPQGSTAPAPAAAAAAAGDELWTPGTPVAEYEEDQWWFGHITAYKNGWYTILWDDGEIEAFNNMNRVNKMVADAETQGQPTKDSSMDVTDSPAQYPNGLTVSTVDSNGKTWTGKIESYYKGFYAIRWDDNSVDTYKDGPKMDQMVKNSNPHLFESGMKPVGKAFLSLFIIVLVCGGAFLVWRLCKNKKQTEVADKNAALEEPREEDIVTYRDEPEEPKII
jgi:hypothetical protein